MIKLSKNGITTLKKQYKSVLLKCLAINAGVFMMTVPAMATEITEDTVFSSDYDGAIYNSSDMGGQGSLYFGDELVISDGVNTANEHIIVGPVHDFENGNNIKITGGETTFVGRSLNTSSGAIEMSGGVLNFNSSDDSENDDLTLWAAKDITINGGTINLNGEDASIDTIYDWTDADGNPYPAPENPGNINISGGTINMNVASQIASEGAINISGGKFNLLDSSIYSVNKMNITGGTFVMENSGFQSGNDNFEGSANTDMILQSTKITATDSDIESTHDIIIKNSEISLVSTNPVLDNEGAGVAYEGSGEDEAETFGIWADNNVSVTDSTISVKDSYIASEKNILIDGSATDLTIDRGSVKSESGDITISGGKIEVENNGEIKAHNGKLSLSGGEITVNNGEVDGLNADISGNVKINVANGWLGADEMLTISGGEINLSKEGVLGASPLDDNIGTGLVKITGGTINAENSFLVAEADNDGEGNFQMSGGTINLTSGSSIYGIVDISGGTINMTDSDIEAEGNMIIKDSIIKLSSTDELNHDNSDIHGIWADGNIELGGENNFELNNSYIAADGDLVITGGNYKNTGNEDSQFIAKSITFKDGYERNISFETKVINIEGGSSGSQRDKFESRTIELGDDDDYFNQKGGSSVYVNEMADGMGHVNVSGGKLDLTTSEFDSLYVNVSGGEVNLKGSEEIEANLYARKNYDITGGTINMNGYAVMDNIADIEVDKYDKFALNISGGTINVSGKENEISSSKEINFTGGTININEGAELGMFGGNESAPITVNFGKNAVYNVGGILNTNITGNGQINITGPKAYLNGNVSMTDGGVMNIDANQALVDGDVTFAKGSTLKMAITDAANGQLKANKIVAEKDSTLSLNITKTMQKDESASFKLFDAETIDNNFSNVAQNARYEISTKDGAIYDIIYKASASDVVTEAGGTAGNAATAEAWDQLMNATETSEITKAIVNLLNQLSQTYGQAYTDALTALAPDTAPAVQQAAAETAGQVFSAVGTRLSGGSVAGSNQGMSSGDAFDDVSIWAQGMFNHARLSGTKKAKGFDADTYGTALGIEKQLNNHFKAGVGYAYSKTDINGFMRDTDVKTHTAILYGEYKPNNWYTNAVMSYGWSDYEEKKNVAGINVKSKYDVEAFGLQAMTGYDIYTSAFNITPEAGLRYIHVKQDAYTDTAGQRVKSQNTDTLTGVLGTKITKSFTTGNSMLLKPELKVAMTYDISHDNSKSTVTLVNGAVYNVTGKPLNRFGVELGTGVTAEVNDNVELSVGYEGKFRKDYQDHSGLINAKYKF